MMMYEPAASSLAIPSPGSPPGMTASKSSKSSSFNSLGSDDNSVLADVNHFEEIGLDDDDSQNHPSQLHDHPFKSSPNPYSPTLASDRRAASFKNSPASAPRLQYSRSASKTHTVRDITPGPRSRPSLPDLKSQTRNVMVRTVSLGPYSDSYSSPLTARHDPQTYLRSPGNRSSTPISLHRHRSPSPNSSLSPRDPNALMRPRRGSWQSNKDRKTALELELECDEDDGDDIPVGLVLDNVPISPRPALERTKSQPSSKAPSPERERTTKARVRSVGNGTPPVALAQGSLRSSTWKSDTAVPTLKSAASSGPPSPVQVRVKGWTAALAELSAETKALTEKLEEHADEVDLKAQRSSTGSMPTARKKSVDHDAKPRVKSALPELPSLRRANVMIDPLPISKEKEAVLSRTRPSWLPPKDPAEERRHLKEYRKMMSHSMEAERRRETLQRVRTESRDTVADSLMRIWEDDIIPRWDSAIRERRTRELWWRGIAPRSRGLLWSRAIGNELGLTETSYRAALGRANEAEVRAKTGNGTSEDAKYASWFAAIRKDTEDFTWRDLRIFQTGAPLHESLVDVLSAYVMYRSDIGYVRGCNTIAALLLLNLPTPTSAFIALANVLNRLLPLSFYVSDLGAKTSAYNLLLQTLSQRSPGLYEHITGLPDHDPDAYLNDVFTSLFTGQLALDEASRLWDVFVFEGDAVLVRAGVALLMRKEMVLLGTKTVAEVKSVIENGSSNDSVEGKQRVLCGSGEEDQWMQAVREAGRS